MEERLPFERIKNEVIVKKESITNYDFGCEPEKRTIEQLIQYGIVNINKPSGPSSHQISDFVKKILNISKAGHSGTIDPKVTGVLPIALEKATRIVEVLLKAGKEYVCLMHLHKELPEKEIIKLTEKFTGIITQLPPVKSAVKRQLRQREVYYFKILDAEKQDILFKMGCQAGTYLRKICSDFGKLAGTNAHMAQLIRTKAGPFNESTSFTLQDLKDASEFYKEGNDKELRKIIQPYENAVSHLPKVWVFDNAVSTICHGAFLSMPGISKLNSNIEKDNKVAIMTLKNELIAIGDSQAASQEIMKKDKGLAVKTEKVFMDLNVYPKFTKKNAD